MIEKLDPAEASYSPEAVPLLQREVQRKLGRCLIHLQQYESLMKAVATDFQIAGPSEELITIRQKRSEAVARMTLGQLAGELTGGYLQVAKSDAYVEPESENFDTKRIWFRMQTQMTLQPSDYEQIVDGLKELVDLRNDLVHHFLAQFDIWSADGCSAAEVYLDLTYAKIGRHYDQVQSWALAMADGRKLMAAFMATDTYSDFLIDGTHPDGTVDWPDCGIVRRLRAAEGHLAVGGWAKLNDVIAHMNVLHPDQTPKRYRCAGWRDLLHQSGQFEIRRKPGAAQLAGTTFFRSR